MRSIIYDVITGIAIVAALFVVTDVMKANQTFIMTQSTSETDTEQVYINETAANHENTYTIADVYGALHTVLKNGNKSDDIINWSMNGYVTFKVIIGDTSYYIAYNDMSNLTTMESELKSLLSSNPNLKFTKRKETKYDNTLKEKIVSYVFTRKN